MREALARLAAALARSLHGRPVAAADVHLTLQFIGEAPRALEPALVEVVRALPPPPRDVPLDRLGRFGARLVWIGPNLCPDALGALSRTVRERLDALGVAYDRKRFVAHLSLVRGARAPGGEPLPAPDPGSVPATLGRCGVCLVESELLAAGSRYRWIGADGADGADARAVGAGVRP